MIQICIHTSCKVFWPPSLHGKHTCKIWRWFSRKLLYILYINIILTFRLQTALTYKHPPYNQCLRWTQAATELFHHCWQQPVHCHPAVASCCSHWLKITFTQCSLHFESLVLKFNRNGRKMGWCFYSYASLTCLRYIYITHTHTHRFHLFHLVSKAISDNSRKIFPMVY